jgi:beta-glucosidase
MSRDPRWGRAEETYGEDPYLTSQVAASFISGMQGSDAKYLKTVATVKHFACNNVDSNRHKISSDVDERSLMEYYMPAFKECVTKAGVYSVMNAYNAVNGVPCPVNRRLLTRILRNDWGFKGYVVSDCDAVFDVFANHGYVQTGTDAAALSLRSGTDLNCGGTFQSFTGNALSSGLMDQAVLDTALTRILKARFLLGEFDPPAMVPYSAIPDSMLDCQQHRLLALQAAKEAIVLLKNENAILPLKKDSLSRIAVIGPNADYMQLGGYSGMPAVWTTPLHGIIDKFAGPGKRVDYALGCLLYGPADTNDLNKAVNAAKNADVAIVVCGTNLEWAVEEKDRSTLNLPGIQDTLIRMVLQANPRTIVVLVSGYPFTINEIYQNVPGVIMSWYNGQAQGLAIADVLFGDYNPGGKLTSTWYKSLSDLPPMDHYDIKENRTYQYFSGAPLFPFGFGLSYTTFEYSNLTKSGTHIVQGDSIVVTASVRNTGNRTGDEVVQFYIHHVASPLKRPVKELKGFQRVTLQPGETKTVSFSLKHADLSFYDEATRTFVVDNGVVDLMLGSSSEDIRLQDRLDVSAGMISLVYRINPMVQIEAEDFDKKSKPMQVIACSEGGQSVTVKAEGDFLEFTNVNFDRGVSFFEARIETTQLVPGILELRLDSLTGPIAGAMTLISTNRGGDYVNRSCKVTGAVGIRNLFLVFRNCASGQCRMNWFRFRDTMSISDAHKEEVQIYPNPASSFFWVEFANPVTTDVLLDIYTLEGNLVWSAIRKEPFDDTRRLFVSICDAGLIPGMYLLRCNANNSRRTCKVCVVP